MLKRHNNYPSLPEVNTDLGEAAVRATWKMLLELGMVTSHMTFASPGKLNKWDRPERLVVHRLDVSIAPIPGLTPEQTRIPDAAAQEIHIALMDQDGDLIGLNDIQERAQGKVVQGILSVDRRGNLWMCEETGEDTPPGEGKLRPMDGETSPLMACSYGSGGADFSLTDSPLMGSFRTVKSDIIALEEDVVSPEKMDPGTRTRFEMARATIDQRLDEINDRQDKIASIIDRVLTMETMSRLVSDMNAPLPDGLMPAFTDYDRRKKYDNTIEEIALEVMNGLRHAGMCRPCPNNGPREVGTMTAWNAWMDGEFDTWGKEDQPLRTVMLMHRLMESTAFDEIRTSFMRAGIDMQDRIWKEQNPNTQRPSTGNRSVTIPAERIPEILKNARDAIREAFIWEDGMSLIYRSENLTSSADGTRYTLAGSFLTPVLALDGKSYYDDPVPVDQLAQAAYIRHMEIPMPSGVLVMADWIRVKGFKEGLEVLCGHDDYDLNTSKGLDDRARDYFEKAGIAIVQVGNTSPGAISDREGIWRMGYFDEEHDVFWTEDDDRSEVPYPNTPWKTWTDLWANTFADRETVVSVLVASGEYESRLAAGKALDVYTAQGFSANSIDLGVSTLHLYAPTGAGIHKGNFNDVFSAEEVEKCDWIEDYYVLSRDRLHLDTEPLEEGKWQAKDWIAAGIEESPSP